MKQTGRKIQKETKLFPKGRERFERMHNPKAHGLQLSPSVHQQHLQGELQRAEEISCGLTESNMKHLFAHFVHSSKIISSNSPTNLSKGLLISHQRCSLPLLLNRVVRSCTAELENPGIMPIKAGSYHPSKTGKFQKQRL